jgi:prophage regulatory protein
VKPTGTSPLVKGVNNLIHRSHQQKVSHVQDKILRLPDVKAATGLSRSTIYKRISEENFPQAMSLGGHRARAVGWLASDIDGWLHRQIETSRKRVA